MRYVSAFSLNAAVGTPVAQIFSANGLYDPDVSGIGHQPYGFDQMAVFYNHYEVLEAVITFNVINAGMVSGFNFGVKLDDNGTFTSTDYQSCLEVPHLSWRTVPGVYGVSDTSISQTFKASKFFTSVADRETWGDASSNPTDQAYFLCLISPITSLQDLSDLPCIACIDYKVRWHEPKDLVPS
jgi:hypothetical protein